MRLPLRWRLSTLMVIVAVVAVVLGTGLGLQQRSRRLQRLALFHSRQAGKLESALTSPSGTIDDISKQLGDVEALWDRVHWHDTVASAYRNAASRPWLIRDPDPQAIRCGCGHHANQTAVSAPGAGRGQQSSLPVPVPRG